MATQFKLDPAAFLQRFPACQCEPRRRNRDPLPFLAMQVAAHRFKQRTFMDVHTNSASFFLRLNGEPAVGKQGGGGRIDEHGARITRKSAQIINVRKVRLQQRAGAGGFESVAEAFQPVGGGLHKKGRRPRSPPGSRDIVPCGD